MTPEERAASLIGRINETTDTASLERMIAEEIRAAVVAAGKMEDGNEGFKIVKHPAFGCPKPDSPSVKSPSLGCYRCGVGEPEAGKRTLYFTTDGYHCEPCVYDEYIHLRTKHLSLFAVQYQTLNEVKDALAEDFADVSETVDYELVDRLAREIADEIKRDKYFDPLSDLISMHMRFAYYRTLRKHKDELPHGFELPPADVNI